MIKDGKLFGKVNIIDFIIIAVVILAVLGLMAVKTGVHKTSSEVNGTESNVHFDIVIKGQKLSSDENLFKAGDMSFITIRNVPYTELKIVKSEKEHWQTTIPDPKDHSKALAVDDPTAPYTYNFFITLEDKAVITPDGPVIGGNKIKIGLPLTLEGYKYRVNGIVSDVRTVESK